MRAPTAVIVVLVLALAWAFWPRGASPHGPQAMGEAIAAAAEPNAAAALDGAMRTPAGELAPAPVPAPSAPLRGFDAVYADILAVLQRRREAYVRALAAGAAAAEPGAAAQASLESELNPLLEEMCTKVAGAGPSALRRLASFPDPWAESAALDLFACRTILILVLQVLHSQPERGAECGDLATALLDHMPFGPQWGQFVHGLLHTRPYLERRHEPILHALAAVAVGEQAYLLPLVRDLLLTLYLHCDAENADLLALAEGAGGAEAQVAALQRLLLDPRYRDYAVLRLAATHDAECMDQAAAFAVRQLPSAEALPVLMALVSTPEGEFRPFAGYFVLSERDPEALATSYEAALAAGTQPAHRLNAVMTLGHVDLERGLATARLAFDADPSQRVRGVALMALSARLPTADFAPVFDRALADPAFLAYPFGWADLSAALKNHAMVRSGDAAFLDRATQALLALLPDGQDGVRAELQALRREYVGR